VRRSIALQSISYASQVNAQVVRHLRELVAAIDRRVPRAQRHGEAAIARDAAALKAQALARLETLERESTPTETLRTT
jgi:hypothetical protein